MAAPYSEDLKKIPREEIAAALDDVRRPIEIAVYGIGNFFNLGAILRTGQSFLVAKYHAIDLPEFDKKAGMTATRFEKKHVVHHTIDEFIQATSNRNVVAFEKRAGIEAEDIRFFKYPENPILLFGNEKTGVPLPLLLAAKHVVVIPMDGIVWDLNVASVAAMALYDWSLKRARNLP